MKGTYGTKAYRNKSLAIHYHNTNNVFILFYFIIL